MQADSTCFPVSLSCWFSPGKFCKYSFTRLHCPAYNFESPSHLEIHEVLRQVRTAGLTEAERTSQVRASVTKRIQLLGRQKRPKEAVTQLAEMARLGVQPDTQAATALIDACVRNRKMEMAQGVFEELFGKP